MTHFISVLFISALRSHNLSGWYLTPGPNFWQWRVVCAPIVPLQSSSNLKSTMILRNHLLIERSWRRGAVARPMISVSLRAKKYSPTGGKKWAMGQRISRDLFLRTMLVFSLFSSKDRAWLRRTCSRAFWRLSALNSNFWHFMKKKDSKKTSMEFLDLAPIKMRQWKNSTIYGHLSTMAWLTELWSHSQSLSKECQIGPMPFSVAITHRK